MTMAGKCWIHSHDYTRRHLVDRMGNVTFCMGLVLCLSQIEMCWAWQILLQKYVERKRN